MEPLDDGSRWEVVEPFEYCVGALGSPEVIFVEKGFITDLASIPRAFWDIFPPSGKYTKGAVLHDFMYTKQMYTRARSDSIFLEAMQVSGVGLFTRWSIYTGVRIGGEFAWNAHHVANDSNVLQ